jgi:predicted DNA-binding transcriptional regulator YafY
MPKKSEILLRARPGPRGPRPAGASRPPLARMVKIHEMLAAGRLPNCSRLAGVFEVSYKTVQRDIDFMRDQLLLPIDYDQANHGFRYTKPVSQFPLVTVSQGELVALLVAQKAIEQYRGTSFEKPLRSAFQKLASSMDEAAGVSLHELSGAVSFRPAGVTVAEMRVFEVLAGALAAGQVVEFDYLGLRADKPERRRVDPYHLACIDNQWYLIAGDQVRGARRTFALTRIRKVKNLGRPSRRPANFSVAGMLGNSFSAFESSSAEFVRIRFDAMAARLVAERRWHKTQKCSLLHDGGVELSMRVGIAPDLEKWILSWGDHAEVVAPESLRERIAACLLRAGEKYATKSPR